MQSTTTDAQALDALEALEQSDPDAQRPAVALPDILVFDTDSKRMGNYGGFFLADDYNAGQYSFTGISDDPNSRERVNSPTNRIPGIHLPELVHFALVAAGPLFAVNDAFHFEAIVFCREVTRRDDGQYPLLKLTTKGPAAVKLHAHFTLAISEPLSRMNAYYHNLARQLFENGTLTNERLENILNKQVTPQMIWIPVQIQRNVQIGPTDQKCVIGAMVYTDEPIPNSARFNSRWPTVPLEELITPDTAGGLLLPRHQQQFCKENRQHYETLLRQRAATKGTIKEYPTSGIAGPAFPSSPARTDPTPNPNRANLLGEIRSNLTAAGKSEQAPDVVARMTQFGAQTLESLRPDQLNAFSIYVRGFLTLVNERRSCTATPASLPR